MTMIERVSMAIAQCQGEKVEAVARAAIAAMREPTDEMKQKLRSDWGPWSTEDQAHWHDMIDAALEKK